ncbi:ABC transporter ATP-binding protein [Clostridium sp. CCUG 7971]|uniref:ABC transporter ATP-binding protein n=1 Tax=Clostridium sp. CCUG 7971 TaxID=2811414 RepID=UPI00336BFFA8
MNSFDLNINKGEFIVILGPSGSGKSTLLEMICGFESPTSGTIEIDGNIINDVLPKDRNVSMVFQDYALFPHMTVYENIAFGMKIRKIDKKTIENKVKWASKILEIEAFLKVKPKKLSGGQRQRVALARAMVREPKLFLMDEPLSNLDSQLRYSTCNEITNLHKKIGATTIYVTHDHVEALSMADRIVILNDGVIQQVGRPNEIYENPSNLFVATFIGRPKMNTFDIKISKDTFCINDDIVFSKDQLPNLDNRKSYIMGIRPEHIRFVGTINEYIKNKNILEATIEKIEYIGGESLIYLRKKDTTFTMKYNQNESLKVGEVISVVFDFNKANIFDSITKENLRRE